MRPFSGCGHLVLVFYRMDLRCSEWGLGCDIEPKKWPDS